jgi:hypothetical protein
VDLWAGGSQHQPLLHRPNHEAVTRVATPDGSVAIEDGCLRFAIERQPFKLCGSPPGNFNMRCCQCRSILLFLKTFTSLFSTKPGTF